MGIMVSSSLNRVINFLSGVLTCASLQAESLPQASTASLKALLVAGGCCHDYAKQHAILSKGIQARANVRVDVLWTEDQTTHPTLSIYHDPHWADGYDVVIHDECAAEVTDPKVIANLMHPHAEIPSVHLHCAMHSFRTGDDTWFQHLGLQSTGHGPQLPINIRYKSKDHPISMTLEDWTTEREELYNNVQIMGAEPIASGVQIMERNGKQKSVEAVVAWVNKIKGIRSFSTSLGHNNVTVADSRYLDLVTRGLLWTCGKLDEAYLTPYTGKHTVVLMKDTTAAPVAKISASSTSAKPGTPVRVSASTTQDQRWPWMAIDGSEQTRWCASDNSQPQWLQLAFQEPQVLRGVKIKWENPHTIYGYTLEGSLDAQSWNLLVDASGNTRKGDTTTRFKSSEMKYLRINGLSTQGGGWISLWEISLLGDGIKSLDPIVGNNAFKPSEDKTIISEDSFAKGGNVEPRISNLSDEEASRVLADVVVPEDFDATLFAPAETANYPVYVAASPEGNLYVSSDGNGSLGRSPRRGRVLRLRDTDADGRADEVKQFIREIDSPRGLVWDHDRLYLLHPPHISVFFDRDQDGVAEDSQRLVSGIAFDFDQRPPDHTTNGLELGIDGWIYVAGGDFGFMDAVGSDGRHLQHRGGGVIRFRPDGSGLELFATGTRNILGTPMSPLLDLFARDNTNDGGGWDVRLHHFSGLEDHGYPSLYKHFSNEHVQPLADYGGGSGCGSVYIHEPGFPEAWRNAPFTCDWGRGATFRHSVVRQGATFVENAPPIPFIKVTRPTDADVDGMSRVYQASWKGPATFNWAGPSHGYIVRVTPRDYTPEPLPDYEHLEDDILVKSLESPSHVRVLQAQRTLLRRAPSDATRRALVSLALDPEKELRTRVAALYAITQRGVDSSQSSDVMRMVTPLLEVPLLQAFVFRALGDMGLDHLTRGKVGVVPPELFTSGLRSQDPRTRLEALIASTRQGNLGVADGMALSLGHEDAVIAHTAYRGLAQLEGFQACLRVLDTEASSEAQRAGAAMALMRMHRPEVVKALTERLADPDRVGVQRFLLSVLCRLYHREGEWKGESWGTRPDTRGPYYQLETWKYSESILATLHGSLAEASAEDAAWLIGEMNRNRIRSMKAMEKIIALATEDSTHVPAAVTQVASFQELPIKAVPILIAAAMDPAMPPHVSSHAVVGLARSQVEAALPAMVMAMGHLDGSTGTGKEKEAARRAFLGYPGLDGRHTHLERICVEHAGDPMAYWAHVGLLTLATRKGPELSSIRPEHRLIDEAWLDARRRVVFIKAAARMGNHYLDTRIRAALKDFDADVAKAAQNAARRLKIATGEKDSSPVIGSMETNAVLDSMDAFQGDVALGEAVFIRAGCASCHTVSQDQAPKGPYLGNIASTYRRGELAEAILMPNKTIAQGFASHAVVLHDGTELTGFVVSEAGDSVRLRDVLSQEHVILKSDIHERNILESSIMPGGLLEPFTMREFAGLLDYLQDLNANPAE